MPQDTFNPPQPRIYVDGKPQAEYEAAKGGAVIRQAPGAGTCRRVVRHGQSLKWDGEMRYAGDVVFLSPERANELGRQGIVCHPADFDPAPPRPVTVRQDGQTHGPKVQGPIYDPPERR